MVSRFLWSQGLAHVDYALATHADADHIGGLAVVVKNFSVGEALVGRLATDREEFNAFYRALAEKRVPLARLARGGQFTLDGVRVEVLHPAARPWASKSTNDESVVLRLVYGSTAILLTGDIEREAEEALVKSGVELRADVMKVPHHGSKTSSTREFLDAVKPRYAVISVGERSRFGHPHAPVIARYRERGTQLLQTGRGGMITVQTDGTDLTVRRYRE